LNKGIEFAREVSDTLANEYGIKLKIITSVSWNNDIEQPTSRRYKKPQLQVNWLEIYWLTRYLWPTEITNENGYLQLARKRSRETRVNFLLKVGVLVPEVLLDGDDFDN